MMRLFLLTAVIALSSPLHGQTLSPSASPSLEQRVADLEAYVNNSARGADSTNASAASNISGPGPASNAWMMTCAALVLFMTLPGLALFYGGLVRTKNVLSILMQCFSITCLVTIAWMVVGYSIAFGDAGPLNAWYGGFGKSFLAGIDAKTVKGSIPETVFSMFQLTFAIITPALVIGAYAERMRYSGMLLFSLLWLLLVYCPVAHWVWGDGWLAK